MYISGIYMPTIPHCIYIIYITGSGRCSLLAAVMWVTCQAGPAVGSMECLQTDKRNVCPPKSSQNNTSHFGGSRVAHAAFSLSCCATWCLQSTLHHLAAKLIKAVGAGAKKRWLPPSSGALWKCCLLWANVTYYGSMFSVGVSVLGYMCMLSIMWKCNLETD